MNQPIVSVNDVSLKFKIEKNRATSLKEYIVRSLKGTLKSDTDSEFWALSNLSFDVDKGDVVGIIGRNGAGKSTLLKVISGIMKPTKGKVLVNGNIVPMLELGSGFDMEMTGEENIYLNGAILGYSEDYIESKKNEIIEFSELGDFIYNPLRTYSSGMVMRLAFSIASVVNPEILIVDEILAVGDANFQEKSRKRMMELMSGGTTVFFVSHDIEQIKNMCNQVLWIEHGIMQDYGECAIVTEKYIESYNRN